MKSKQNSVCIEDKTVDAAKSDHPRRIGIIGTGNFGRALAKRLICSGYDVIVGSRRPSERQLSDRLDCLCEAKLTSIRDCLNQCDIVCLAVHVENFKDTFEPIFEAFANKIVIDVSNREYIAGHVSNAEYLQTMLPTAKVVKAFNIISAYHMENDLSGGSSKVFVASDHIKSRDIVCNMARDMGFAPLDFGRLASSRRMEAFVLRLFPGWKIPIFFTCAVFNIYLLYIMYCYYIEKKAYSWDQMYVKVLNKPICMTAITILSLAYMPGCIAAFAQLINGTKHKRFPKWLDLWLKSRKQLGLISFILVFMHVIMSVLIMSPTYYSSWFQSTKVIVPANNSNDLDLPFKTWMIWKGEAASLVGIVAFIILCLIAVTALPSVGDSMNWREWRFVQSTMGHSALILSTTHVIIMGAPGWQKMGFIRSLRSITLLSVLLPFTVILMKIILSLPCVSRYVKRIRKGWERGSEYKQLIDYKRPRAGLCAGEYKSLAKGGGACGCGVEYHVTPGPSCDCTV